MLQRQSNGRLNKEKRGKADKVYEWYSYSRDAQLEPSVVEIVVEAAESIVLTISFHLSIPFSSASRAGFGAAQSRWLSAIL